MKKKEKLKLDELKVESFITSLEGNMIQGGAITIGDPLCGNTQHTTVYGCEPATQASTNPYPCPCDPPGNGGPQTGAGCATNAGCTANTNCGQNTCGCPYTWFDTCGCAPQTSQYTGCYC